MALPKSVKKQVKDAKALQDELNQPPAEAGLVEGTPQEQEQAAKAAAGKKAQDDIPKAGEEPTKGQGENWEKRFKGLNALYNREVPKLRGELEKAYGIIDGLKKDVDDIRAGLPAVVDTPAPESVELSLTDEEREQYGDNWIDFMTKIATQNSSALARQVVDLQRKLSDLEQGQQDITETVRSNTSGGFFATLASKVKAETGIEWKDINTDPEFHVFLAETVPYTQNERQFYLLEARKNLDVDAVAQFFIDFAKPSSQTDVSLQIPETPAVPEEILQPLTNGGDMPPIQEENVYTEEQVTQFYRDRREGKFKGKENEARELEKDILAAGRAGRIVDKRQYASA